MAIQGHTSGVFARARNLIDRVISPATRSQFYNDVGTFSNEKPILAVRI